MVEQCCKPPFFLHLCALPLKVTVFLWWHLTKWLCPLIMPSHALDFSAIQPQTNVRTLPHTFTHRVRGSSIHLGLDSCTLFHLMPNQEWSLDAAMEPNQGRLRYVYMHTHTHKHIYKYIYIHTHKQAQTAIQFQKMPLVKQLPIPHLLKLSDCVFVRWRGRVSHYFDHCACASFRRRWLGKPTHCGDE